MNEIAWSVEMGYRKYPAFSTLISDELTGRFLQPTLPPKYKSQLICNPPGDGILATAYSKAAGSRGQVVKG